MKNFNFSTERLLIAPIHPDDDLFIFELLNTESWINNIGDKKIHTRGDALQYILALRNSPASNYWVMRLKENNLKIGVVTCMQRNYLPHADIGFALLPAFERQGYAYEAAHELLTSLFQNFDTKCILATVLPSNSGSIKLIKKLGLEFHQEIEQQGDVLHVYKLQMTKITK